MPNIETFHLQQEFLIVGAAVQSGLFEAIKDKPLTLEELSGRTACDKRALWTVVEALTALDYLEYTGNKIKMKEEVYQKFYEPDSDGFTGFSFMHTYYLTAIWLKLPEVMKTGKPASTMDDPESLKAFITAMSHYPRKTAADIAGYCLAGLQEKPRVLDVGGGPLTIATAFAQQGAEVTIVDLPEVVDMMTPGLDPDLPITMKKGDFTIGLPEGPFDMVYLGNVCHIYGEKENRKLFGDSAEVLEKNGRIVITDSIRGTGPEPALFAVNMLLNTDSGGTWTYDQYKNWLQDAGFSTPKLDEIGENQLLTATKQ
jgi:ubiquinone/menaquinone biosynthesis C-methylase UbiE